MNDLADATVMTFAGTAVRGSAIPSPTEGMVTYLADENVVQVFDGSAYKPVGGLVEVKHVLKTNTFTASVTAGNNVAVTDLSITHEVRNPANRLIISAFFGAIGSSSQTTQVGIAVHDGTGLIAIGDAGGSRTRLTAGGSTGEYVSGSQFTVLMPSVSFVHTPGAGSKTYTVRAVNVRPDTQTLYVNRNQSDSDAAGNPRAASAIIIQEVAV
jgi:hypothetical protein